VLNFKINYTGSSKILIKICEKLNSVPILGTNHEDAYFGDRGEAAYQHSLQRSGNPHRVSLEDLGIELLPNQMRMLLDAIGALDSWISHDRDEEGEITYFIDHEGDYLVFVSASNLLAWH
jgi:hypothetical protein